MNSVIEVPATVPYPRAMEDHPTLRQSKLSDFDRCALMAKFALTGGRDWAPNLKVRAALARLEASGDIDGELRRLLLADLPNWGLAPVERAWSTHEMARGSLMHRAVAKCLKDMFEMDEERLPDGVAEAVLEEVLRQHDVPLEDVVTPSAEHIADMRWTIRKWAAETRWTVRNLMSIEERLETTIYYPSDHGPVERILTGQLDALFAQGDQGIVLDWKDTWALPPETEVSFTGYFQQRMYGLLVLRHPDYRALNSVTLKEWYLRHSEPRTATIRREQLPEIEAEMSALAERFDRAWQNDSFVPTPGKHCSFCTFPERCPIEADARGDGAITNDEQARTAVAEIHVAEKIRAKRIDGIKAYANRTGFIPLSDAKGRRRGYGYKKRTTKVKPSWEDFEKELRRVGSLERMNPSKLWRSRPSTVFGEMDQPFQEPGPEDQMLAEQLRQSVEQARERRAERV